MFYVRFNTHVTDHPRFAEAGSQARDLWTWGMLYAGKHETDGELTMAAVLASPWGAGGKANVRVAAKLVEVGLWECTDRGFRICRWSDQGNKTRAELEEKRAAEREKKANQRKKDSDSPPPPIVCPPGTEQGTPEGTPEGVLNSLSKRVNSLGRESEGESARGGVKRELRPDEPFTSTRAAYVDTLEMQEGIRIDGPKVWAKFVNDRISRGIMFGSHEQVDAAWRKWAGDEVDHEKKRRADDRERKDRRDARFADHSPKHEKPTDAQAKAMASELAARVAASRKGNAA
jgi:hypothetical protein